MRCAGVSLDKLSEQFGVHRDAIWRHMERHVTAEAKISYLAGPAKIAQLAEVAAEESESVLDYLRILRSTLFGFLDKLAASGDHDGVAAISSRALDVLREFGKATGQISQLSNLTTVQITNNNLAIMSSAPFADLQSGLLEICTRHPDARADIIALIDRLDAKYASPPAMKTINAAPMIEARA